MTDSHKLKRTDRIAFHGRSSTNFRRLFHVFRLFIKRPPTTLFMKSGGYSTKGDQDIGMEQKEGNYTRFWRKVVSDSPRESDVTRLLARYITVACNSY